MPDKITVEKRLDVDAHLHQAVKVLATIEGKTMLEVTNHAILYYLKDIVDTATVNEFIREYEHSLRNDTKQGQ